MLSSSSQSSLLTLNLQVRVYQLHEQVDLRRLPMLLQLELVRRDVLSEPLQLLALVSVGLPFIHLFLLLLKLVPLSHSDPRLLLSHPKPPLLLLSHHSLELLIFYGPCPRVVILSHIHSRLLILIHKWPGKFVFVYRKVLIDTSHLFLLVMSPIIILRSMVYNFSKS